MEFSKAEQVIVLPIKKGGTNANTAAQAVTNIFGEQFANYSGVLPVDKGGTGATTNLGAQYNLNLNPVYSLNSSSAGVSLYIKIATIKLGDENNCTNQIVQISGISDYGTHPYNYLIYVSGNTNENTIPARIFALTDNTAPSASYIDRTDGANNWRDFYLMTNLWPNRTYFQFLINNPENSQFTTYFSSTEPAGLTSISAADSVIKTVRTPAKLIWS
ncbi:MAG: hypothetical protein LBT91_02085 [Bifidobacteriaceae bacterium]|nr:hypothetical protein [Bifidobacteriaceae bacterium]